MIASILIFIWVFLMVRSVLTEYQYYQSVKTLEPNIWAELGYPTFIRVPIVFVSPRGSQLLKKVANPEVQMLARKHRTTGIQFVSYVGVVLLSSILYFNAF